VKYAFIQRHKRVWPIRVQCRVLCVSVSGYHEHLVRRRKIVQRCHLSDEALLGPPIFVCIAAPLAPQSPRGSRL